MGASRVTGKREQRALDLLSLCSNFVHLKCRWGHILGGGGKKGELRAAVDAGARLDGNGEIVWLTAMRGEK